MVRLRCGNTAWSSEEYAGDDGLIVRTVRQSMCVDGERPLWGEMSIEGADGGGWYWINGDRNVAAAPLVCESSLNSAIRPPIPEGVTASPSGDRRFVLDISGRLYGTFVVHDYNGLIGIIPHLTDLEGDGEHVAPFYMGRGGIVGRPLDGVMATIRVSCRDGVTATQTLNPGDDGIISTLLPGCFDPDGDPIDGTLEADGFEDGSWYWINRGRIPKTPPESPGTGIAVAAPLVRRDAARDTLTVPVVPGGVDATVGPFGTLFVQRRLMGVVPRVADAP